MSREKQFIGMSSYYPAFKFYMFCIFYFRCETCNKDFKESNYLRNHYLTKLHQRRMAQFGRTDYRDAEMREVSDEDIGFDLPDSIIEELDE